MELPFQMMPEFNPDEVSMYNESLSQSLTFNQNS